MALKRTTRSTPAATTTTTTTVTDARLKALIYQGVANALATRDANRSRNGEDSHDSGSFNGGRLVILSEDDYRRRCEKASDLESGFYMSVDKLDPSYKKETNRINLDGSFEVGISRRSEVSDEGGVT
ncbi:hypothetical protein Tco_1384849 [Tanacetum coccineum]